MDVLVYKYHDAEGRSFLSAKSKGSAFLNDSAFGAFLSLTVEAMAREVLPATEHKRKMEEELKSEQDLRAREESGGPPSISPPSPTDRYLNLLRPYFKCQKTHPLLTPLCGPETCWEPGQQEPPSVFKDTTEQPKSDIVSKDTVGGDESEEEVGEGEQSRPESPSSKMGKKQRHKANRLKRQGRPLEMEESPPMQSSQNETEGTGKEKKVEENAPPVHTVFKDTQEVAAAAVGESSSGGTEHDVRTASSAVQSISFELCGRREPHLVAYDFDLALKPLFVTHNDGAIRPWVHQDAIKGPEKAQKSELGRDDMWRDVGPCHYSRDLMVRVCRREQERMLIANEKFRASKGITVKYEYNHFIVEGRVLYILDGSGMLCDRTMYKIKPPDIEEVHWATFARDVEGRVREALQKCAEREKGITERNLRDELDMGPKEWSKFGGQVMKFVKSYLLAHPAPPPPPSRSSKKQQPEIQKPPTGPKLSQRLKSALEAARTEKEKEKESNVAEKEEEKGGAEPENLSHKEKRKMKKELRKMAQGKSAVAAGGEEPTTEPQKLGVTELGVALETQPQETTSQAEIPKPETRISSSTQTEELLSKTHKHEACLLLLVGLPGSGKTTFANILMGKERERWPWDEAVGQRKAEDESGPAATRVEVTHKAHGEAHHRHYDESLKSLLSAQGHVSVHLHTQQTIKTETLETTTLEFEHQTAEKGTIPITCEERTEKSQTQKRDKRVNVWKEMLPSGWESMGESELTKHVVTIALGLAKSVDGDQPMQIAEQAAPPETHHEQSVFKDRSVEHAIAFPKLSDLPNLEGSGMEFVRVSQDDMGSKEAVKRAMRQAFSKFAEEKEREESAPQGEVGERSASPSKLSKKERKKLKKQGKEVPAASRQPPPTENETPEEPSAEENEKASQTDQNGWEEKSVFKDTKASLCVIVDRVNFDVAQRRFWIGEAKSFEIKHWFAVHFDIPAEICKERVMSRVGHPTLPAAANSAKVIYRFSKEMVPPMPEEGFRKIWRIGNEQDFVHVIQELRSGRIQNYL